MLELRDICAEARQPSRVRAHATCPPPGGGPAGCLPESLAGRVGLSARLDAERGKVVGDLSQILLRPVRSRAMPGIDAVNHRLRRNPRPAELSRGWAPRRLLHPRPVARRDAKAKRPQPPMRAASASHSSSAVITATPKLRVVVPGRSLRNTAWASSAQHRAACLTDRKDRRLRILRRTGPNTGVLERGLHVLELSRSQLGRIRR